MTAGSISVGYRRWFGLYLLFVATVSTVYGFLNARRGSGWAIGEWLTNYSAGFIRRGLVGEVVLLLGRASGINLVWIVFGIQVAVYLTFLWCVYRLTEGLRWGWMVAALLLSPATLGSSDRAGSSEWIQERDFVVRCAGGAVICLLLYAQVARLADGGFAGNVRSHSCAVALTAAVLSTVFFCCCRTSCQQRETGAGSGRVGGDPVWDCSDRGVATPGRPGYGGEDLLLRWRNVGTFGVADDSVCGGSIAWLQQSLAQAHANVMVAARVHDSFSLYGLLAIAAVLPAISALVMLYRRDAAQREVRIIATCSGVAVVGSLVIFYSGRDWGRWIHIHAVCLMLLVLMVSRGERPAAQPVIRLGGARRWAAMTALAIYATCWTLPAVDIFPAPALDITVCTGICGATDRPT